VTEPWPNGLEVSRLRIARPTDRLADVVHFYRDGLGLVELGGFQDHDGYDGVFLGLPDEGVHLEFTTRRSGSPGEAPSRDNLLVLYGDGIGIAAIRSRMAALGVEPVEPENRYWVRAVESVTFEDPDGWRVVLVTVSSDREGP
jgi:catechol 2,3-dioxygenase-like lactoylglutathione lyase family enzyme